MIIYPLPPSELDDKTLDRQIKAIAQCLCNVHYFTCDGTSCGEHRINGKDIVFNISLFKDYFDSWASDCLANYNQLADMGLACCYEYVYRFHPYKIVDIELPINSYQVKELVWGDKVKEIEHKLQSVIEWARDNVPDLLRVLARLKHPLPPAKFSDGDVINVECAYINNTPFPLVMPEEYIEYAMDYSTREQVVLITESYRNYYRAKLSKDANWTRREKPNWI